MRSVAGLGFTGGAAARRRIIRQAGQVNSRAARFAIAETASFQPPERVIDALEVMGGLVLRARAPGQPLLNRAEILVHLGMLRAA